MSGNGPLVAIRNVVKRFGSIVAVNNVSLDVHQGEFFALLGPSGCGKTTLLRMLAGFETPDSGEILLEGEDLVGVKPWKRPVNMMFQSYALFPHMTVYNNVAYGLREDRLDKREIDRRVREVLEMVGLLGLARRKPDTLSGGQKQRVALARAIVKQPKVLLLDEPLAALDRKLRVEMRLELKRLQHEVGIAFIFVTHDQEEALTMADRAAVMNAGQVLQVGTPQELYELPTSLFVANFIGESNVFTGSLRVAGDDVTVVGAERAWRVSAEASRRVGLKDGDAVAIVIRPEHLQIIPAASGQETNGLSNTATGMLIETAYLGSMRHYIVELEDGTRVMAQTQAGHIFDSLTEGTRVSVGWELERGVLVPADDEALIEGAGLSGAL